METAPLTAPSSPAFSASAPPPTPPTQPTPPGGPPPTQPPTGMRVTPDPTRSGAMWVGGAGVALLLAAAAVLTAVRWDEIGQSVKLGGLVAITLALLTAGQRFKETIPMTAQAIFHLGALLIPFDMAAVAILAGRSWQETLLLTSLTSVVAWYGIERAVPSPVLLWCARGAVVGLAAGIASVSPVAMPVLLAIAAVAAIAVRRPIDAAMWAVIAGVLPIASMTPWPPRIAGAMTDLGFDMTDQWQPLIAGLLSMAVLVGVTRVLPRLEVAWAAVAIGVVTGLVALQLGDSDYSSVWAAGVFLLVEMIALFAARDVLWKSVLSIVALGAEAIALVGTSLLITHGVMAEAFSLDVSAATIGVTGALLALGWLTADRRRLDDSVDWMTGLLIGSDWPVTTLMFPVSILAILVGTSATPLVGALVCVALAFWMVATWRTGAAVGAVVLVAVAAAYGTQTEVWFELGLGALGAAVLALAAQLRLRAKDSASAIVAGGAALLVWLTSTLDVVAHYTTHWPLVVVLLGAWALSWIIEARGRDRTPHVVDFFGRAGAMVVMISSLWTAPIVAIVLCASVVALTALDHYLVQQSAIVTSRSLLLSLYAVVGGSALGLVGIPVGALAGLSVAATGTALTMAAFVLVGIALVSPQKVELAFGTAALVGSVVGLAMSFGEPSPFAIALIAFGSTAVFVAVALRDVMFGAGGFIAVGLGIALQLAVWDVTWVEPYLVFPAIAALAVGYRYHRSGGNSWAAYAPTIAVMSYVAIADRLTGGSAWHAVIAGSIGVLAVIGGGYRRLAGPLVAGSVVLAIVVGYESLGPAALVPTWAWLALGGSVLLASGVAMERSDTTPLERGQQLRAVIANEFS